MKKRLFSILIFFGLICHGQTTNKEVIIDKVKFENSEIQILSTETVESSEKDNKTVLKFKFIDNSDGRIKFYEAELDNKGFVGVTKFKYMGGALGSISIMTVPFKIRSKNEQGFITAKADVKNVGLYFPIALWDSKRYWINNSTTTHKISCGLLIAPMAQELNDKNTNGFFQNSETSYSAFMLSTSLSLTYTYNKLTFGFIPLGFDFGLDEAGKKWDNHANYWAGFGLGIDTKLFGF